MKIAACFAADYDTRPSREAMRAWTREIVDGERAPVTSNVCASELVGKAELGRDTGPGRDTLFHREMPDEISPCPPGPRSPGGRWGGTQTGRDSSVWGPMSN